MPIPGTETIPYPLIWRIGQSESPVVPPQQGMVLCAVAVTTAVSNATWAVWASPNNNSATYKPDTFTYQAGPGPNVFLGPIPFAPVKLDDGTAVTLPAAANSYTIVDARKWWGETFWKFTGASPQGPADAGIVLIFKPII
jgi:hypothetical protein